MMREEQCRHHIPGPAHRDRQFRHAQPAAIDAVRHHEIDAPVRRVIDAHRCHQDHAGPAGMHRIDCGDKAVQCRRRATCEIFELELIGRNNIGDRYNAFLDEFRDALAHEDAATGVANHRVAAAARRRICALHPCHGINHDFTDIGRANIAGEYAVAFAQHTAFLNSLDHQPDRVGAEKRPAPGAVAGVIGELHGMHRPYLNSDALEWKHGSGVASMAIGDVGLDGDDVHAGADHRRAAL
jgi:hypothetical protein